MRIRPWLTMAMGLAATIGPAQEEPATQEAANGGGGTILRIVLYLVLPMIWGLLVEHIFETIRRRRAQAPASVVEPDEDDE